jgi:competence protein ComEA
MFRTLVAAIALVGLTGVPHTTHAAQSSSATRQAAKPTAVGPVNINAASAAELEGLPGIGAKTAGRIIEYRQKNGPFKKIEELMNVRGVGEKNFLKLKDQISVGASKTERVASQQP